MGPQAPQGGCKKQPRGEDHGRENETLATKGQPRGADHSPENEPPSHRWLCGHRPSAAQGPNSSRSLGATTDDGMAPLSGTGALAGPLPGARGAQRTGHCDKASADRPVRTGRWRRRDPDPSCTPPLKAPQACRNPGTEYPLPATASRSAAEHIGR